MVDFRNIPLFCPAWYFLCYAIFSAFSMFALGMVALMERAKYDKVNGDELYSPEAFQKREHAAGYGALIYGGVGVFCLLLWVYGAFIKRQPHQA